MSSGAAAIRRSVVAVKKNHVVRQWPRVLPDLEPKDNTKSATPVIDESHFQPLGSWTSKKLNQSRRQNPFLMTWAPGKDRENVMNVTHGEGVYLFDDKGNRYLDWTSQAVCSNLGHSIPKEIIDAAAYQMSVVPFLYGGMGIPEVRVRLNQLLNELLPGDLGVAVYPSSGAEANEAGMMMARRVTGRPKILSWFRSYHGATAGAGAATGDSRRWYGSDVVPGHIKAFNPFPLFFSHGAGVFDDDYDDHDTAAQVESALLMLEEQILNEGPEEIASFIVEPIVGAGGCLVMPVGYMQGVRAICDKYGILLHFDEVMVGFGRTGKMFGFQHYDGVLPDIVTCAKGISSSSVPLSMTACRPHIMEAFDNKPLGWGSTYQAHAVAMAAAYESIKYLVKNDVINYVGNEIGPIFEERMHDIANDHPCIKQYRAVGLFGCLDVHNPDGTIPRLQHEKANEAFVKYKKAYKENGLNGLHRYPHIHCAPPLVINKDELLDGFDRLDRTLNVLDEELGF